MAKKTELETPTNIISNEPVVLPTETPAASAPSVVNQIDMKPFADAMTAGFNSLADKLTSAFKAPAAPVIKEEPLKIIPAIEEPAVITPPKKSSGRIFDELDPTGLF